jgi:large subunit ribosomal protein L29
MKNTDIRELSDKELKERIGDERAAMDKMTLNHSISPVENPNKIRENKRLIARLLTEQRRRQLANVQS